MSRSYAERTPCPFGRRRRFTPIQARETRYGWSTAPRFGRAPEGACEVGGASVTYRIPALSKAYSALYVHDFDAAVDAEVSASLISHRLKMLTLRTCFASGACAA
jgi:hypothetical protein